MNIITDDIGVKLLTMIDHPMELAMRNNMYEPTKTYLETNVFTRFDDSMNHSFVIWGQVLNEINYAKH